MIVEIENNSVFNPNKDIKPLEDYNELDGKLLKMMFIENKGTRIVAGQDLNTRKIYVFNCENIK